jgi:hypothetical protein
MPFKTARTPLGLWQYDPQSGMNSLNTEDRGESWCPLQVSIALTGRCYKVTFLRLLEAIGI